MSGGSFKTNTGRPLAPYPSPPGRVGLPPCTEGPSHHCRRSAARRLEDRLGEAEQVAQHGAVECLARLVVVGLVGRQEVALRELGEQALRLLELPVVERPHIEGGEARQLRNGEVGAALLLPSGDPPEADQTGRCVGPERERLFAPRVALDAEGGPRPPADGRPSRLCRASPRGPLRRCRAQRPAAARCRRGRVAP